MRRFTVTDLVPGALMGQSAANAISPNGTVVGVDSLNLGFVWTPAQPNGTAGASVLLPTDVSPGMRPVTTSTPMAVNAAGVVAGSCDTVDAAGTAVTRAFRFVPGGLLDDLGTLFVDPATGNAVGRSAADGLNGASQVVGWAEDASGVARAFLWDPGTRMMRDLLAFRAGIFPPGTPDPSSATDINDTGLVVGSATFLDPLGTAVRQAFSLDVRGAASPLSGRSSQIHFSPAASTATAPRTRSAGWGRSSAVAMRYPRRCSWGSFS